MELRYSASRLDDADGAVAAELGLAPAFAAVEGGRPRLHTRAFGDSAPAEQDRRVADLRVPHAVGSAHDDVVEVEVRLVSVRRQAH